MKKIGIGIIGLGNIGSRLYKEIISKKNDIGLKTNTNINIVAISAKNINKKRIFKIKKKIFYKNPLDITKNPKVNIVIELIGKSDGISKRIVESSSESDGSDCDEAASESESENSDDYRKLIAKLFPSKYMKKRVKEINNSKKSARRAIKKDIEESETKEIKDKNKRSKSKIEGY